MTFFKKAWVFLKTHWYLPLLLVGMVVAGILLFGKKNDKLLKMFQAAREKYQKEIEVIETNAELKKVEKQKEQERTDKALVEIEKKIDLKKSEISKTQKKRVKELVKEHGTDYDKMAELMADEFGFEVVE